MDADQAKRAAAERAAALVEDGMTLGLGTGSTARWFIAAVAELVRSGMKLRGVPTSIASERQAREGGIELVELDADGLDLAVDGADAVDDGLRLIKGAGGAMVREKLVAVAARRFVVVVDASKLLHPLAGTVPVEIVRFGVGFTMAAIEAVCGIAPRLRPGLDGPFVTDNGNVIADIPMPGAISDPEGLAAQLEALPGVVGHGLFLGLTDLVLAAHPDGSVEERAPA